MYGGAESGAGAGNVGALLYERRRAVDPAGVPAVACGERNVERIRKGREMMFFADAEIVDYCPRCGERVSTRYGDGGVKCGNCKFHFYVSEGEDSEEWDNLEENPYEHLDWDGAIGGVGL